MIADSPRQKGEMSDTRWIAVILILLVSCLGAGAVLKKSGVTTVACYDTGETQVVSVHNSGIQSSLSYQHEVQCSNGETYWK